MEPVTHLAIFVLVKVVIVPRALFGASRVGYYCYRDHPMDPGKISSG